MSSISLAIPNRIASAIPVGIAMMIQPNAVVKNSSVKLLDWTIKSMYVMSAVRRITIAMIPVMMFICFVLVCCCLIVRGFG